MNTPTPEEAAKQEFIETVGDMLYSPHYRERFLKEVDSLLASHPKPEQGIKWVNNNEGKPTNEDPIHIRYYQFKDVAYFFEGKWYNAATDKELPPAFIKELEWLDESPSLPEQGKGEEERVSEAWTYLAKGKIIPNEDHGDCFPTLTVLNALKIAAGLPELNSKFFKENKQL